MKNINWGEILQVLSPISLASVFGAVVTAAMKILKIFKDKDKKFSKGFFFQLIFESFSSCLFGILFGALIYVWWSDSIISVMAFAGIGGAFGERLYLRLAQKLDTANSIDDLNPVTMISEEQEQPDSDNQKKKSKKK